MHCKLAWVVELPNSLETVSELGYPMTARAATKMEEQMAAQ